MSPRTAALRSVCLVLALLGALPVTARQGAYDSAPGLVLISRSAGLADPTREGGRTEFEVADVDGDGQLDIVSVGDHGSPNVNSSQRGITLYFGDGGSSWSSLQSGNFGYGGCALGDLDLDGVMDIVWGVHHDWGAPGFGGELMGAALGNGTGANWTPWGTGLASNGETWGMFASALADFDCDGDLDMVSQSFGGGNGLRVYRNNRDGTWTPVWSAAGGSVAYTLETCDVNADGYPDIVSTRSGSNVYLGDGAFGFSLATTGLPAAVRGIHTGDMDGDGDQDLVLCTGGNGVRCYRFDAASSSWSPASAGLPTTGSYELSQLGDLNGDGTLDIVAYDGPTGRTYLGDGAGNWTADATWVMPSPGTASGLRVDGDIDHDGREDIVVAGEKSGFPFYRNQLRVYSPWLAPEALGARVTEPRGGEVFRAGSVREVRWLAAVPPGTGPATVELELSLNGAAGPWSTLAAGLPDNGRWQWTVDPVSSNSCRIRVVVSAGAGSASAISPGDFAIVGGTPVALTASAATVSEAGGTVGFDLEAGAAFGGRDYLLLATAGGTQPGTLLPGGLALLPLNLYGLSLVVLANLNTPLLADFAGLLDGQGDASAQLNLPPLPGTAGLPMQFAFLTSNPFDFASNAVQVTIAP